MAQESGSGSVLLDIPGTAQLSHLRQGQQDPLGEGSLQLTLVSVVQESAQEEKNNSDAPPPKDDWLVVNVGDLELPVPSVTQVVCKGPRTYIWPAAQSALAEDPTETDGPGFIQLELPSDVTDEDLQNFEIIMNQRTALAEADVTKDYKNKVVLVDEPSGHVVGDLSSASVRPDAELRRQEESDETDDTKDPVVLDFDESGETVKVSPISSLRDTYGKSDSKIVGAAEFLSRGVLFTSEKAATGLQSAASTFTSKTAPYDKPMVFSPKTHAATGNFSRTSGKVVHVSRKTIGAIGHATEKVARKPFESNSKSGKKPGAVRGFMNNSFIAFNTLWESVETGGKHLLETASTSSTDVVEHRWGPEAGEISRNLGSVGTNVALVYIDARGVSRRALLKSAGKGIVKARMENGDEVVFANENEDQNAQQSSQEDNSKKEK